MLQKTDFIWQNGQFIPWDDAKTHVLTHTLHYGGGAFEGLRFYQTAKGTAIFRAKEHIERLFYSMNVLSMRSHFTLEEILEAMKALIIKNHINAGYIRPLAFYGYGKLGVNPIGNPVELIIACWPWGAYLPHECVDIKVSHYIRIHPDSTDVKAKLCGHYVNGILASLELQGTHYHESLFLDSAGFITEGVGENFFMVKQGVIYTPRLGDILPGITRNTVFLLAQALGLTIIEADISLFDVYQADEAFFTGTAAEVTAIGSINDKPVGQGKLGPITQSIKQAYLDVVQGRNKAFHSFLTFI